MTALAVLLWGAAALWLVRLVVTLTVDRGRWSLEPEDAPPPDPGGPLVSILVPARNEEATLGACLASALAQDHPRVEIVVADDHSTDGTLTVARAIATGDDRVTVLSVPPHEPGWRGKCAALWAAQAHARGPWLLFLDADVRLHPRAVSAALAAARTDDADMMSWLGQLELGSFWERVVLPVIADMITRWAPLWRVNRGIGPPLANGQFLLFRRELYDAVGGHRAVRGDVVEDVALCRLVRERFRDPAVADEPRYRLYRTRGLMETRMYRSLRDIWLGFAKNSYTAMGGSAPRALGAVLLVLVLDVLPWVALPVTLVAGGPWLPAGLTVVVTLALRLTGRRPSPHALLHPLGALVTAGILVDSALRGVGLRPEAAWKGRPGGREPQRAFVRPRSRE